jgi:hypothetical protein
MAAMSGPAIAKGQLWRAYFRDRPARQVFVKVQRVARDGSWADIIAFTWAVMWRKRQPLKRGRFPFPAERFDWDMSDLAAQEMDWDRARRATLGETV